MSFLLNGLKKIKNRKKVINSKKDITEKIISDIINDKELKKRLLIKDNNFLENTRLLCDSLFSRNNKKSKDFLLILERTIIEGSEKQIDVLIWNAVISKISSALKTAKDKEEETFGKKQVKKPP